MGETPDNLSISEGTLHERRPGRRSSSLWWVIPTLIIVVGGGWFIWQRWLSPDNDVAYSYNPDEILPINGNLDQLIGSTEYIQESFPDFVPDIETELEPEEARSLFGAQNEAQPIHAVRGYAFIWRSRLSSINSTIVEFPSDKTAGLIFDGVSAGILAGQVPRGISLAPESRSDIGDSSVMVFYGTLSKDSQTFTDGLSFLMYFKVKNSIHVFQGNMRDELPGMITDSDGTLSSDMKRFLSSLKQDVIHVAQRIVAGHQSYIPSETPGQDTDRDGLTDVLEALYGTSPNSSDTDRDGFSDFEEVTNGFDPISPS